MEPDFAGLTGLASAFDLSSAQQCYRKTTAAEAVAAKWAVAFDSENQARADHVAATKRLAMCTEAQESAWRDLNAVASGAKAHVTPPEDSNLYGSKYGTRKG